MIKLSDLSYAYPQTSRPVLQNVHIQIEPATLTLVTGATGSGKSTLLRCINGLVPHFSGGTISGQINVFDHDPIQEGPEAMARVLGFVFQEPESQFVFDIVEDEIAFALENAGLPREKMLARVDDVLNQFQIEDIRGKNIYEISGGEKQKVAIASALVQQPSVLILDEPTSQLDPVSADKLLLFIKKLKNDLGLTVIISEHRLERLLPYTDKIIHITEKGHLLFGTPRDILAKMEQVPPIIQIAKKFEISPLPLTIEDFPKIELHEQFVQNENPSQLTKTEPTLEIFNLSTTLGKNKILEDINIQLFPGEILTLVGLNGAGKTTLLRSILGLAPSRGHRRLHGIDMGEMTLSEVIHHIAYLPQNPNDLLFAESVEKELRVTLDNHGLEMSTFQIADFLELFHLNSLRERYPRDLSVGERQRTALAAITVHQPEIILLDEPTRGLDYQAKKGLSMILQRWRDDQRAILLVTHDVEFAAAVADRAAILDDGQIRFDGSPKVAFSRFPAYHTQTSRLFPNHDWITPEEVKS